MSGLPHEYRSATTCRLGLPARTITCYRVRLDGACLPRAPRTSGLARDRRARTLAGRAAASAPRSHAAAATVPPNVLIFLSDDQSMGTLRATPNVRNEIAAPGVSFSRAYISDPLCCPSRSSILTGLYSTHTGVFTNGEGALNREDGGTAAFEGERERRPDGREGPRRRRVSDRAVRQVPQRLPELLRGQSRAQRATSGRMGGTSGARSTRTTASTSTTTSCVTTSARGRGSSTTGTPTARRRTTTPPRCSGTCSASGCTTATRRPRSSPTSRRTGPTARRTSTTGMRRASRKLATVHVAGDR